MRNAAKLSLALFLALAVSPALHAQEGEEAEARKGVQWTESYDDALKMAKAENKRIFIEFTATW